MVAFGHGPTGSRRAPETANGPTAMPTIDTHLFSIEAPEIFEKALWMGQLIRMERMDRAEDEDSFAEVNFFVGHVAEEGIDFADGSPSEPVLKALWAQYLDTEERLAPVAKDAIIDDQRTPRSRLVLVKLAATSFRPEVGQLVWLYLPEGKDGWVFARFTLEFDWRQREQYEALGRAMVSSVRWKEDIVSAAGIEAQAKGVWSIFDEMDLARRDAIALRYREVLGQVTRAPMEGAKEEPKTLDLRGMTADEITVEAFDAALVRGEYDSRTVMLQTAFLPDPIEFTCASDDQNPDSHQFGEATVAIIRALQSLSASDHGRAGELMWQHCKICFDATDYGAPESQSNEDYFDIHGPEQAFAKAGKATIYVHDSFPCGSHDLFSLDFYPPWEDEHGCSLVIREGQLVGGSDPGGWLGEFLPKDPGEAES